MEDLTLEEKNALIKEKPEYGSIVCRCEMITEGEIMEQSIVHLVQELWMV